MKKWILSLFVVLVLVVSCNKEKEKTEVPQDYTKPVEMADSYEPSVDIIGEWHSEEYESIEFREDGTFSMSSLTDRGVREMSGIYEQAGEILALHFFQDDEIVLSSLFLTFSRQHKEYRSLYLMLENGEFLHYSRQIKGDPEEERTPEGTFIFSTLIDENSALWSILDLDSQKFSIAYKGDLDIPALRIMDCYIDGNELHYTDGCYTFEVFELDGIQYLFALENGNQSMFFGIPGLSGLSFPEIFTESDFSFLDNTTASTTEFNPIFGAWTEKIHTTHNHGDEVHAIGVEEQLILKEDNPFYWSQRTWHEEDEETTVRSGRYYAESGHILFEYLNGDESEGIENYNLFVRQKEGYKVLYLMDVTGSFRHFTQNHKGTAEDNPLLEGVYESSPDWSIRDNEFFLVDFNDMKAYIYDYKQNEEGMFIPYLIQDIGRDGNHAYAIGMEGDFEAFRFEGKEYAFGVFSNGFHMTMWKDIENE